MGHAAPGRAPAVMATTGQPRGPAATGAIVVGQVAPVAKSDRRTKLCLGLELFPPVLRERSALEVPTIDADRCVIVALDRLD